MKRSVSDTAVWFLLHSGSVAKINNTNTPTFTFKTSITMGYHGGAAHSYSSFADLVIKSWWELNAKIAWTCHPVFMTRSAKLEQLLYGWAHSPSLKLGHLKIASFVWDCMEPGCIGKSNTDNLPAPTELTENPYGEKKHFFFLRYNSKNRPPWFHGEFQ